MMNGFRLTRRIRTLSFYVRQARVIAKALKSPRHPISAHIVPIRRCNLSCNYCNEYDSVSHAVPIVEMLRRVDRLAALGTTIITLSGGEPLLHPELDEIIRRIPNHGIIATLITNGYFLTPNRIKRLNAAGLDHLQISVDNVLPDEVSKKSLKVLDKKLQWLGQYAEFQVNINCVIGAPVHKPEDAVVIARRARELGLVTTVGIIHDRSGQLRPLSERHREVYEQVVSLGRKSFATFAHYNQFQKNLVRGLPNDWHCHAGSRYLYVCENGLVHYCSQQRGYPGISLEDYTSEHLEREYGSVKPCAPFCTISCVHQVAMIDQLRENPVEALAQFFPPKEPNAPAELPFGVSILAWFFPPETKGMPRGPARTLLAAAAMRILGIR